MVRNIRSNTKYVKAATVHTNTSNVLMSHSKSGKKCELDYISCNSDFQ